MFKRNVSFLFALVLLVSLAACTATQTPQATIAPTIAATAPTSAPTIAPTKAPTTAPTTAPTIAPTAEPTKAATAAPTVALPPRVVGRLLLATTTSTQDSGLLDYLLPMFTQGTGIQVDVVAVGSGQAMKIGEAGDADVLLVHSPAAEKTFMEAGNGTRREDVMYNDFVIIGPADDPAAIKGMTAVDAFKKLAETQTVFLSRSDASGTNAKELSIWKTAAITPTGNWYLKTGLGMGDILTMAQEKQVYTISDRATYLTRVKKGLDLPILVEGEKALFNPYGVIAVKPEKSPLIQADLAIKFIDWIISVELQAQIAEFGKVDYGQTLFYPSSALWKASQGN
ncbi:MAG: ABC transporter substrate-binding protein [Anaerolineae bacterium]